MSKYYVAAEANRYCGAGMFGSLLGFTLNISLYKLKFQ